MTRWQTKSSEEVYKTPWIRVRRDEVLNHAGKPLTYSVVELASPAVFIIALDEGGRILMQRMYRYTTNQTGWEIPAGHSDGEDLLAAAKRELMEEAGLASDDWTQVGKLYEANGIADIPGFYFLARNARPAEGERDEEEDILEQRFMSLVEIEELVRSGEANDATVLVALELVRMYNRKEAH